MAPELTIRTLENPHLVLKRLVCSKGESLPLSTTCFFR